MIYAISSFFLWWGDITKERNNDSVTLQIFTC